MDIAFFQLRNYNWNMNLCGFIVHQIFYIIVETLYEQVIIWVVRPEDPIGRINASKIALEKTYRIPFYNFA